MKLRPYQVEAVDAVFKSWQEYQRTLLVLPTGCGKTICFAKIAEQLSKKQRVLILAHRDELIRQAADKISKACGLECAIEKANETALGSFYNITSGSVQTLMRQKRLEQFSKDYYGAIIIDEAHHALSDSYKNILNYFSDAKVLGVTATPDRGDKRNLSEIFDNIAYEYSIRDAITNGYLSKIVCQTMPLHIELDGVKISKGDYDVTELGNTIEPYLEQIANHIPKDRRTLIFLPLVATSKKMTDILKNKGFKAEHIDGKSDDRKEILQRLNAGEIDVLCNSMLLTEGFDEPSIDCVVCLRPTKSRSLYAQIIGRGTRLYPNKENLLVLDFLWHSSRHDICHSAHLIAPKDEIAKKMRAMSEKNCCQQLELLELESDAESETIKEREYSLAQKLRGLRTRNAKMLDPLQYALSVHDSDLQDYEPIEKWEHKPPSGSQLAMLEKNGFDANTITCKGLATKILERIYERQKLGLCTPKQMKFLQRQSDLKDIDVSTWTKDSASAAISVILSRIKRKSK